MVSIFTGNGLGVFQSSATQLGQGSGTRLGQGRESHGINVATGNLVLQAFDEGLIVRGQSAAALRTYNSRGQVSGMGQDGWATGYERWVELDGALNAAGSAVRYHNGEGDQIVYAFDAARGMYVATAGSGAHDVIAWDESGWYRYQDGNGSNHEYFESNEYQQSGEFDPQPRALLRWISQSTSAYLIHYDALGRVSEVVSSIGYPNGDAIVYAYEGNTQRLVSIATRENGVVRTQVTYGYDPAGRLSWVQTDLTPDNASDNAWDANNAAANDGRLFRTRYAYVSGDAADLRIAGVTASDGATVSYTYESDGAGGWRVKTVTEGSAADGSARTLTFVYGAGSTDVVDAAGRTWTYRYDANRQLIAVLAPAVDGQRQTTSYEYDAAGNVTRIATSSFATATGTGGASVEEQRFRYDGNGNRIQQRDLQGNVIAWTYNQANRPTSETRYTVADADGLDADETGNTSMPSGAMTTRYVYESDWSDRLRFVINAEGEVRELTYESTAPYYDWMLASERRYLGDRYAGTAYTDQALTAWANDTAAQRRANSSLISHAYDAKGRLVRSIEYATVTANAAGNGVLDAAASITRYVHDAQGLLRQSIVSRGAGRTAASALAGSEVTEYVYDGMGRLLSVLRRDAATAAGDDASTLQTIYSYVDSENRIRVAQDNGLLRIEARNRAGELLSVTETGAVAGASTTRTRRNHYDDTGRLRASEDAAGGRSYFFYDTAGRLIATVDPTGAVSRTEYDSAGRVRKTTRYATVSNTQGWLAGGAVTIRELVFAAAPPASLAADQAWVAQVDDDRVAQMRYDSAGRLVRATDNAGSEISYEYDGAGRLVRSTEWGDEIYSGGWGSGVSARRPSAPSRETRVTRMFYDNADRLVATLDAEGYLGESVYDAGGRLAKTIRYATRTDSAYWASGTLQQLRPTNAAADQTTRLFHDARGRQIGQLDAEGYLTEMVHDEQNNQRATREYAKPLTGLSGTESLLALRTAAMTNAPAEAFRETTNSYNGLGQLIVSRNHEGTVTRYIYDEAGRLLKTESAADTSEIRAGGLRYDVFGHLIGEISGDGAALLHAGMTESELDALYAQYGVRHRYDALGRRIESTDALGHKTWYFHDEAGRQRYVVRGVEDAAGLRNALGEVTEMRYTAFGDVADTLSYDGRIAIAVPGDRASAVSALQQLTALAGTSDHTQFAYDRAGRLIRRQDVDGAASEFEYNRFGELRNAWRSSAAGEWVSSAAYTYDRRGQRIGTEESDAYSWRNTGADYDAFGRVVRATDARGTVSEFSYDRLGRQIDQVLRNVGGQDLSTQTSYDAFDRVVAQIDAMGGVTQYSHSDAARSLTVVTPEGIAITTVHNAFGQTIETRQPLPDGSTAIQRTAYDNRGLLIGATDALGHDTTHQYDARGQLIRVTDATGRSVAYAYDAVGRTLSRSEDPDGLNLTTRYVYDAQGRQLQTTDPSGRVSRMTYDRKGQLIELAQDPDGMNLRTVYTWDGEGNRLSVTSGAGTAAAQTTAYEYDGFGRRISETLDPGGLALRTEYVYDANDNVIARSGYGGSARYAYDAANRLRYGIDALGGISETVYDANGRVVAQRAYARALDLSAYGTAVPDDVGMAALIDEQGLRDDARDVTRHVVYDRDGRARLTINGAGEVTESVYDSAGRKIASKAYAQRLTLTATLRDSLAAGAATVDALLAATPHSANDSVMRYFHDANGRLVYSVDGNGGMSRTWYDKAGRAIATRAYATPAAVGTLDTATIASLDAQVDPAAAYEGESRIHDGAGRLRFILAADNVLRETRYDAAGNVASTLRYFVPADIVAAALGDTLLSGTAEVADFGAFVAANEATAASSHSVYDAAGRLRLSITRTSATGAAVVEQQYDQVGRVVGAYAYTALLPVDAMLSSALSQGAVAEATLSTWLNAHRGTAQVQRMVYDAAGRMAYSIDGAGAVTSTRYDAIGMVASVRRHAQAVMLGLHGTPLEAATIASALVETAQDRVDYRVHDAAGRVVFRVHADASVEEIRYDAVGRVSTTLAYGATLDATLMAQVAAGTATASSFASHVATHESAARAEGLHYDQAGRVRYRVVRSGDGLGQVVETQYDGIGRETARIRYGVEIGYALGATEGAIASAIDAALSTDAAVRATQVRTMRYYYDAGDRQRFAVDASGAVSEQRFDAIGRVTQTRVYGTLPAAGAADMAALSAWAATQAAGSYRMISMAYDRAGQVTSRTDALGQSEFFQYDAAGNITRHTDRAGAVWNYAYDRAGRRTAEISPAVVVRTSNSRVVRSVATRMEYDGVGNLVRRTENADTAQTRITRYEYDNRGNTVRIVLPDPATGLDPVSGSADTIEIVYDTLGQAVSQKDPLGHRSYRVYDTLGRVIYDIDQEQQVTSHVYNAFGEEVRSVRHANRLDTSVAAFGAAGWLPGKALTQSLMTAGLSTSAADRGVDSSYTVLGQKHQVQQDAVSYVKSDGSVATGRPTLRTRFNAYGEAVKTSILIEGTPDQVDAVWADTYRYYDALGRETVSVDAEGYVNSQSYTLYGEVQSKTEHARRLAPATLSMLGTELPPPLPAAGDALTGNDRRVDFVYDALGRVSTQTVKHWSQPSSANAPIPVDVSTHFGYDAEGRTTSIVDGQGTTTTRYDALGRMISVQQPSRSVVAAQSDAQLSLSVNTNLVSAGLYEQRSPYTELEYDAFGNAVRVQRYANGKVGAAAALEDVDADQVTETEYDRRGRVVTERDVSTGVVTSRTYDAGDRVVSTFSQLRGRNTMDLTAQVDSDIISTYTYDKTGRQLSSAVVRERYHSKIVTQNGVSTLVRDLVGTSTDASEIVRYNAFGEVVAKDDRISDAFAAGTPWIGYVYDNAGRMLSTNAQGGAVRHSAYDLAGRVVRTVQASVTVDAQGVEQVIDAVTRIRYDKLGRAIRQELPSNSDDLNLRPVTIREYDRWGNVVRNVDARGYETLIRYNSQNKAVMEIRPEVKVVNADGTEVRARPTLTWHYDDDGRMTESRDANGNVQRMVYDNIGRNVQVIDALGNVTRMAYDLFDRERYVQNPQGYITYKTYDRAGRAVSHGDFVTRSDDTGKRQMTGAEYYALQNSGDRWEVNTAMGFSAHYDYDSRHLLLGSRSAAGVIKSYAHDLQGRKIRETNGDPQRWRYLLSLGDVNGTITGLGQGEWVYNDHGYTYDDYGVGGYTYVPEHYSGPAIRKDREGEYVFVDEQTWDYDVFGRLIDHNDLGGADYDYIYHAVTGQLIRTTRATSSHIAVELSDGYDGPDPNAPAPDGTDGNASLAGSLGLTAPLGAGERSQFYYASGLVKEIREGGNWTRYAYDENGNRTMEETYTRDGKGNLVHLRTVSTYDAQGRLSLVRQFDMTSGYEFATVRYSYDAAGNRRRVSLGNAGSNANAGTAAGWNINAYAHHAFSVNYGPSVAGFAPETVFQMSLTQADGSPLPSWLNFDPATGIVGGTPPAMQMLTLRLTARSIDDGSVVVRDIAVKILPSQPPQLTYIDDGSWQQTLNLGQANWTFSTASAFMDPEGLPLQYSAMLRVGNYLQPLQPLPAGMQIDAATGVISGVPAQGVHQIVVTATDSDNQSVSKTLTIAVDPWQVSMFEGDTLDIYLPDAFDSRNGQPPSGYVIVSMNNAAPPAWLQLLQYGPGDWYLTGTPAGFGMRNIGLRAIYADGSIAEKTLTLDIRKALDDGDLDASLTSGRGDDGAVSGTLEERIALDLADSATTTQLLEAPIEDDGSGGNGGTGGNGGNGGSYTPVTPGATYVQASSSFKSFWYDYDAMNRVTVVNGRLQNGAIVLGVANTYDKDISYALDYDAAGREIRRRFLQSGVVKYENTQYNERGQRRIVFKPAVLGATAQVAEILDYDAAGRLTSRMQPFETGQTYAGQAKRLENYTYDADGRQLTSVTWEGFNERYVSGTQWYGGTPMPLFSYRHALAARDATENHYDLTRDGRLAWNKYYHISDFIGQDDGIDGYTFTYLYTYDARESYLETRVNGYGTGNFQPGSTTSVYDGWGRRVMVQDGKDRLFAYDAGGNIIQRKDSSGNFPITRYAFVDGRQTMASASGHIDAVSTLTAYRNSESGSGNVTVQGSDTLRSIAGRVYGNESLWYVLAAANALDGNETLTAGATLKVPEVKVNRNDADTFKPFNPADVIGSTTPSLDYVPPPPKKNCSALSIILTIVVVIIVAVVTIYTAGAAAPAGASAVAGVSGTMATGAAVLGGAAGFTMGTVAAVAAGAVAGAVVGQLASMAFGLTDKFDWGAIGVAALVSVATMGVGSALSGGQAGAQTALAAQEAGKEAAKATAANAFKFGAYWAKGAAQAVAGNLANYGANWAINRIDPSRDRSNEKFSWANLAASAVSGAVTAELGNWLGGDSNAGKWLAKQPLTRNSYVREILTSTANGFIGSAVQHNVASLLGEEGRPHYGQMAIDAFGNALADATVKKITDIERTHRKRVPVDNGKAQGGDEGPQGSESADEGIDGKSGTKRGRRMLHGQDRSHGPMGPGDDELFDDSPYGEGPEADIGLNGSLGGGGDEEDKALIEAALSKFQDRTLTEMEAKAVKDILGKKGFILSVSAEGGTLFNEHDFKAAQLYMIDPDLAASVPFFVEWSPGSTNFTKDDFIGDIQAIVGVRADGVYGANTREALKQFIEMPVDAVIQLQEIVVVSSRGRGNGDASSLLGSTSMFYESGQTDPLRACAVISNGQGDPGGVSYGAYQLSSTKGTLKKFLRSGECAPFSQYFVGISWESKRLFKDAWKAAARNEGAEFFDAQHAFIDRTHYQPIVDAMNRKHGVDIRSMPIGVQNSIWSTSVQHGKAEMIVNDAFIKTLAEVDAGDERFAEKYVNNLYDRRSRYVRAVRDTGHRPASEINNFNNILNIRYPDERRANLELLRRGL